MIKQILLASNAGIAFLGATEAYNSATITLPTVSAGDVVIVASLNSAATPSNTPTGYILGQNGSPSGELSYRWSYKVLDAADTEAAGLLESATVSHIAMAFKFVDNGTPLDVASPTANAGTSGMPNSPSVTSVSKGAIVIIGFLNGDQVTATAPSGYQLAVSHDSAAGTLMAAYKLSLAGAHDADAFGGSGSDFWAASSIALRAA